MSTIYDRCRITLHSLSHIRNKLSHSKEIAAICSRASSMSYALTTDPTSSGVQYIPHAELRESLAGGKQPAAADWFGEGERPTFVTSVAGGSALGILLDDTLIVAFRGTSNIADWGINLYGDGRWLPLKVPLPVRWRDMHVDLSISDKRCFLHGGFSRIAASLSGAIDREIKLLEERMKSRHSDNNGRIESVIYCGHSLGGALALLAPLFSHRRPPVYTFGMPRAASESAVLYLPEAHFRYVTEGDPVPHLPPRRLGFVHDGPAVRLDPYLGLPKPGRLAKFLAAARTGVGLSSRLSKGASAMFAAEHDLGAYIRSIDAM